MCYDYQITYTLCIIKKVAANSWPSLSNLNSFSKFIHWNINYTKFTSLTRKDSTSAPSPQTYATAAFGEGRVHEGANLLCLCQATDSSEQSQRDNICEPLTAVAEREDQ